MPHPIYFRVFFAMKTTEGHGSDVNSDPAPSEAEDGLEASGMLSKRSLPTEIKNFSLKNTVEI